MTSKHTLKQSFIPFAKPDIGQEEIANVVEALQSGWITTGPKTKQFELDFANYLKSHAAALAAGKQHDETVHLEAIAVNSATAGLHLALEACGIGRDDEVIVPTLTFTATAEVVRYLGAHPVFVDCDLTTLNIDIKQIVTKITAKTKAIIVVHFAGLPCDMEAIIKLAKGYNLKVIEDAAHALPAKINNVIIGCHQSDAIVYSFYANKNITTGEGGMIVTANKELANRCRVMRLHGISRDAFDRYVSTAPSWYYEVVAAGFKYNLSDIASSIGIAQLAKCDKFHQRRRELAGRYYAQLVDLPFILPPNVVNEDKNWHAWHLFVVMINEKQCTINRDLLIKRLSERGIGTSVHFIPLHKQPYWRDTYRLNNASFPNANYYYERALSLPLYTKLSNEQQDYIIETLHDILGDTIID